MRLALLPGGLASMTPPDTHLRHDWAALAAFAAQIRDDRARRDPGDVAKGTYTPEQATNRARLASALADIWAGVAARDDLPATELDWRARYGAWPHELTRETAAIAAAATRIAAASPDHPARIRTANLAICLAWWHALHRPEWAAWPRIAAIHAVNQQARATRPQRAAA